MAIPCHCEQPSASYNVAFSGDVVYTTVAADSQWIRDVSFLYGIRLKSDVRKLERDHRIGYGAKTVDLGKLAAEVYKMKELKNAGLKNMARFVLGKEMEKPKSVTRSRWDNRRLTADQVHYACIDAYVSFEIGRVSSAALVK
ncbi:hypothetical protein SASPL_112163 [Salvia splendens]|uniref:3'-5' exonuclease domain-containing protein n=1 Tax=Salvia splendens TaxID=180675 RepID=A0A8X9A511_SALSN|nr:hypothetical protein SASPL_112163 [Salvia splendens]